jgi:hypothetical protein
MPIDLFGRFTTYGLGTDGTFNYVWVERDTAYAAAADSLFYVASAVVVMPGTDGNDWDSYAITAPTPPKLGSATFDIFFPNATDNNQNVDWLSSAILHLAWSDVTPFGDYQEVVLGLEQDFDYDNTDTHVLFGPYNGNWDNDWLGHDVGPYSVAIDRGSWYTAKVSYQITGAGDLWTVLAGYKLWKTADVEPTDYLFLHETNSNFTSMLDSWDDGHDGEPWLEFFYTGTVESYLDNLTFDATAPTGLYRTRLMRALIKGRQDLGVCDPLTTTNAYGLGSEYPFIPGSTDPITDTFLKSTTDDETLAFVSTDGSKANMAVVGSDQKNAYRLLGKRARAGYAQFDFFTPAPNPSVNANASGFKLILDRDRDHPAGLFAQVIGLGPGGTALNMQVGAWWPGSALSAGTFIATNNSWYTAKVIYDDSGTMTVLVKLQGTADSSALFTTEFDLSFVTSANTGDRIVFRRVANGQNIAVDNICWNAEILTADALFTVPPGQFNFPARADIRATLASSLTANANLLQALHSITGNASINGTVTRNFLADSLILPAHFYADALITDNGLIRHWRERDHSGYLDDTSVVLDAPLGPYPVGTTLHDVLLDLWKWIEGVS